MKLAAIALAFTIPLVVVTFFLVNEQNIKIETIRLNSSDMPAQLAAGGLEAGGGSFNVSLVNAVDRGLDIKMVADKARCLAGTGHKEQALQLRHDGVFVVSRIAD